MKTSGTEPDSSAIRASTKPCSHEDETLTGYLDGVLTQGDAQRVRLHLEQCSSCRSMVEEMRKNRHAALTSAFPVATDDQWDETPRGWLSRWTRNLGWTTLVIWLLVTLVLALWLPDDVKDVKVVRFLLGGSLVAWGALFFSVLLDRLQTMKGDIYRGVKK